MGIFVSSEKQNGNTENESRKETTQEAEEGDTKAESVCTGKAGVPNKTTNIQKGKEKGECQKKDI